MLELLKMENELLEEETPASYNEEWIPASNEELEWYIDTINNEIEQNKAIMKMVQAKMDKYKERLDKLQQENETKLGQIQYKADTYIETQDKSKLKVTKTQEKLILAGIEVIRKKNNKKIVRDEEKLLKYIKDNEKKDFIKTKESVDWSAYKKTLQETESGYVNKETGEIVEGVTLEEPATPYEIKIKELV